MKKSEFYIHRLNPNNGFEKVSGYVGTFTGNNGEKLELGFDRRNTAYRVNRWIATELSTGLKVNSYETRKAAEEAMTPEYVSFLYGLVESQHDNRVRQMNEFLESIGLEKNGK